jgi:2-polyprenyl-6-methoxyphenol hydroxylase-like FAD-dependent oxidoreductase
MLVRRAGEFENFEFVAPATVRDLRRADGQVTGVVITTAAGERQIEADLVIGADGRASVVRKRAGLRMDLLPESYDIAWFKFPTPPRLEGRCPVMIFASGPGVALAYVSWDGRLQCAWMIPKGSWSELRRGDWLTSFMQLLPDWLTTHVEEHRSEIEGPVPLDVIVGRCPRWHDAGVLLLGDAAHPMSPVRAQGINMALRDAIVAANHLVSAAPGDDPTDALAAIQLEREPEIVRVQTLQMREVRGQRWARERPWLMKPLLAIAPLFANAEFTKRAWLRQQREFRFGVTEVKLNV